MHAAALQDHDRPTLTRTARWTFTIVAGLTVANLYYNQPLLPGIAAAVGVAATRAGLIGTLTQVGYAVGLLLIVPLGDIVERRRLIVGTLAAVALSLALAALGRSFSMLCFASLLIGVTTVTPQIILPFAAGLARPEERGTVVGQIMAGLLVGILGGRVLAGALARYVGWRGVFGSAAVGMAALAATVPRWLPTSRSSGSGAASMSYRALLRSLMPIVRREPVVRDAALLGALAFASFSAFWTTLAFRLRIPPLHYGSEVAGLFGLLGIAGALTAPLAGRMADRSSARHTVAIAMAVNAAAWVILWLGGGSLVGLATGVILLDAATQAAQVSNQARIYALPPDGHSRFNTVYMVAYFAGGAAGSGLGATALGSGGWGAVCAVGIACMAVAGVVLALHRAGQSFNWYSRSSSTR